MNSIEFNNLIHSFKYDVKAFNKIFEYYFPRITIFIDRKYKSFNIGQDVAQEFFMKLFRIEIPEKVLYPTIWVFNACDNLAKTQITSSKLYNELPFNEEIAAAADVSNFYINCDALKEDIEILENLDSETIEIFIMHFWEGYNFKEIAEKLGIHYDVVRQKVSRGLKKIKKEQDVSQSGTSPQSYKEKGEIRFDEKSNF